MGIDSGVGVVRRNVCSLDVDDDRKREHGCPGCNI